MMSAYRSKRKKRYFGKSGKMSAVSDAVKIIPTDKNRWLFSNPPLLDPAMLFRAICDYPGLPPKARQPLCLIEKSVEFGRLFGRIESSHIMVGRSDVSNDSFL